MSDLPFHAAGREDTVKLALESPDETRQSRSDQEVLLSRTCGINRKWPTGLLRPSSQCWCIQDHVPTDLHNQPARLYSTVRGILPTVLPD